MSECTHNDESKHEGKGGEKGRSQMKTLEYNPNWHDTTSQCNENEKSGDGKKGRTKGGISFVYADATSTQSEFRTETRLGVIELELTAQRVRTAQMEARILELVTQDEQRDYSTIKVAISKKKYTNIYF